jgi:predicted component of type VI protein secretion system
MAKNVYGYDLGAKIVQKGPAQGVKLVPDNRTLIVLPFSEEYDEEIDPTRLKSLKEIFEHYKPSTEVEFKNIEGDTEDPTTLKFQALKDFKPEGIVEQVPLLQDLEQQAETYARFADIFQNNEKLINVLANEDSKKELLELIDTLIQELS